MFFKKYFSFLVILSIFIAGVFISYYILNSTTKLKIFNPADINEALVDSALRRINKKHRISPFELINQEGQIVTQKNFEGKIYVADFFFTTCESICPVMGSQMLRVYNKFMDNPEVMILSHTVMPEVDSVPVLFEYAKQFNVNSKKWMFVTGEKKQIYELARKSYFAVREEGLPLEPQNAGDEHDFIHTENFILIDKNKRIRGFYDGTSQKDVDRLIEEIEILRLE